MIKGSKIDLTPATLNDRRAIYEWCFNSETTKSHAGADFPEVSIPTYEEFYKDYEDYYFTGERAETGRGFLIVASGEPIGFISYCAFHLKPHIAELDIWFNGEASCGKGFGTDAIITLGNYLNEKMAFHTIIMRPSIKNAKAIRAYEKAELYKTDKPISDFLLDEYLSLYGDGDYGADQTVTCVKCFDRDTK